MQVRKKSGTGERPVFTKILETFPAGGLLRDKRFNTDLKFIHKGALVRTTATVGLYDIEPCAICIKGMSNTAVKFHVRNARLFQAGDAVVGNDGTAGAWTVTHVASITKGANTDIITLNTTPGVGCASGQMLYIGAATGGTRYAGHNIVGVLKDTVTIRYADGATLQNVPIAIVRRGTMRYKASQYGVPQLPGRLGIATSEIDFEESYE